MSKQERNRIKQILVIMVLGWFLILGFNYLIELPGSKADQLCPITGTVHGTVTLQPESGNNVIDCSAQDIVIASDGELVVERYYTANGSRDGDGGAVFLARNLTVEAGGKITATGKGYQPGETDNGTGNGANALGQTGGSGGGYGGAGGEGVTDGINQPGTPGVVYGGQENPRLLGGAGGNTGIGGVGGAGGGNIELIVSQTLTLNGVIEADGLEGSMSTDNVSAAGGGAGGSILIEAGSLAGSGSVSARGAGSKLAQFQGGGGGGGRVQMFCTTVNNFTGQVSVLGGETSNSQDGGTGSKLGPTCRPSVPTVLKQYKLNLTTEIPVGGATAESSFYLAGNLADPDSYDLLYLEVEVRAIGTAFSNSVTHSQASGYANPQACTGTGTSCGRVNVTGLTRSTQYHWQARVRDNRGGYSAWVSYGGNDESATDILLSGQATTISLLSGNNQSGVVNTNLNNPLVVRVTDSSGFPVPGFTISWSVYSGANGGGLLGGVYTETNLNGEASNTYRLGKQAGTNNNVVRAAGTGLTGSPISFTASGNPDVINYFILSVPDVSLVDTNFNLLIKGYDQFNNIKSDLNDIVSLSVVDPLNTATPKTGILTPNQVVFNGSEGGQKTIALAYNTAESIKIKATLGTAVGYSNTIAIVTTLGSCPDVDGIVDTNQTWAATTANNGIFDCTGMTIRVMSNAVLTLQSYDSGDTNYTNDLGVTVLADQVIVETGSTISGDQTGYAANRGPGAGGSYGGYGHSGTPYGDFKNPLQLGSGGNRIYNVTTYPGGGAIKLVANSITIDGALSSNGGSTVYAGASANGSGSAGGSIMISTETLNGSGVIRANGGLSPSGHYFGRGGAGGRIAIYYSSGNFPLTSKTNIQTFGASGPNVGFGGAGTIFIDNTADANLAGMLYVNNNNNNGANSTVIGVGPFSLDLISVKEYGHLTFVDSNSVVDITTGGENAITGDGTATITVNGIIKLPSTFALKKYRLNIAGDYEGAQTLTIGETTGNPVAQLTINAYTAKRRSKGAFNDYQFNNLTVDTTGILSLQGYDGNSSSSDDNDLYGRDDYGLILDVANTLEIKTGGQVEADKRGFAYSKGPGIEGTYGGYGQSGTPYGNLYFPEDLGSGGGKNSSAATENAGGAIKINVSNLINNGAISANGGTTWSTGASSYGTGSSGGSIWINAVSVDGAGVIRANGGAAPGGHYFGRGGGGGRIAVYYDSGSYDFSDKNRIQAFGGYGANVGYAGAGTIFIDNRTDLLTKGTLYVNNNAHNGREAGVPGTGPYEFDLISIKEYGHLKFLDSNVIVDISTGGENAIAADGTATLSVAGLIKLPETFSIKKFTLDVIGDYEGASTLTVGEPSGTAARLKAYAYTVKRRGLGKYNDYQFNNLTVESTGTITLVSYDGNSSNALDNDLEGRDDYGVILEVANVLDVKSGGNLESNALGYVSNAGPGGEGSYGGYGQSGNPYGDLYRPVDLGTAGGTNGAGYAYPAGGAIKIEASQLINNGTISSNGGDCVYVSASAYCTGSSGGSIWIDTVTIDGVGLIRANGGAAPGGHYFGRGGGGGRIAVYYDNGNYDFTNKNRIQAFGGYGANVGYAGAGTIFIDNNIDELTKGILYVNNNAHNGREAGVPGVGPYEFDLISIKEYGHLKFLDSNVVVDISTGGEEAVSADGTASLSVAGLIKLPITFSIKKFTLDVIGDYEGADNLTVGESSGVLGSLKLYAYTLKRRSFDRYNDYQFSNLNVNSTGKITLVSYDGNSGSSLDNDIEGRDDYGVILNAENLDIATGGLIEANNTGYVTGAGPGGEGSYGGYAQSGYPYGSVYEPISLGTAGGANGSGYAYPAGGAIKINTTSLTNNGRISSNGGDCIYVGASAYCSGSSGGSIWIDTDILNGLGTISANGGAAPGGHYFGWGGSGGRIAIYYNSGDYDVTSKDRVQAFGGYGANVGYAGAGTVFIDNKSDSLLKGVIYVNNNTHNGKESGVAGVGPYEFDLISIKEYGHLKFYDQDVVVDISTGGEEAVSADGTASLSVAGIIKLPETFSIKKFTLDVTGDYEGATTLSVGEASGLAGRLKLYAYTAKRNSLGKKNIYQFNDLNVNETGTLTLVSYNGNSGDANDNDADGRDDYGVYLDVANLMDIKVGGLVEANSSGYVTGAGPGGEGSYGGYGQSGNPYGSYTLPLDMGTAGGSNGSGYAYPAGGVIRITSQTLRNNGTISANGGECVYVGASAYCSGSSGGSVLIETSLFEGNGLVRANGGGAPGGHYFGRGGSGGRIAIYFDEATFDITNKANVQTFGGYGPNVGYAGPGTIYYKDSTKQFGSLIIENNSNSGRAQNFNSEDYFLDNLSIGPNVLIYAQGDTEENRGTRFKLTGDFTLSTGAKIDGVGKGFPSDQGPGAGEAGQNLSGGGGGANGGSGGAGQSDGTFQAQGGQAYNTENQMQPLMLGSGGGQSGAGALGGTGGGAVAIDARYGNIDLFGTIDVSGTNGLTGSPGGGGGAGGSILLIGKTCSISGNLIAEGGDGGDDNFDGGGGGGGRASILATSPLVNCDASTARVLVTEGLSTEGLVGQEGTYVGVSTLPQIELDSQSKLTGELIPVGGVISDNQVRFTVEISDPGATLGDPKDLVADFEVVETSGSFTGGVLGLSSVTSDVVTVTSSDPAPITVTLSTGLTIGEDYMWRARVRNVDLGTVSEWSEFGDNENYPDFSISSTQSFGVEVNKTEVEIGEPIAITVSALDGDSVVVSNYLGTVSFTYSPLSDPGPNLPSNYTFSIGDSGVHTFNDELMFFSPGDYQVIVTDVNNPSITGASAWITVLAPPATPTPTPTETPIPSVKPYGDETTQTPSPTTDNVVASMTPTAMDEEEERDCFEDPLQPKCQVNVLISNVKVTVDSEALTSEICFDTNIATIGVIKYGTESYTDSSEVEKSYRVKNHCITLDNLASAMGYIFKIEAVSYAGKRGSYEGTFVTEGGVTPVIVEPKECIVINSTSFTDDHRAVLDYETSGPAMCQVAYGSLSGEYAEIFPKESEELIKHRSYLDLIKIEPYTDLMYRILCEVKDGDKVNSCEAIDVISWNKIKTYYPEDGYRSWKWTELVGRIGEGLPFVGISFLGLMMLANLFALPQLPLYGLFILRRKKRGNPWGVVYDREKKVPVSFAVLRLYDTTGKLIEQSVSNLEGKYGFVVDKGDYRLEVVQSGYQSTIREVKVLENETVISEDIGLSRKSPTSMRINLKQQISVLTKYMVYIGFVISLVAWLISPEPLNLIILLLYIGQALYLWSMRMKDFGVVKSGIMKMKGVFVRVYDIEQGRQIEVGMSDSKGRYQIPVKPGRYLLGAYTPGYELAEQPTLITKNGQKFLEIRVNGDKVKEEIELRQV